MPTSILTLAVDVMLIVSLLAVSDMSGLESLCILTIDRLLPDEYM